MTFNVYYFLNNYYLNKYSVFQVRVLTNSKPEWLTPKDKVRQTFFIVILRPITKI